MSESKHIVEGLWSIQPASSTEKWPNQELFEKKLQMIESILSNKFNEKKYCLDGDPNAFKKWYNITPTPKFFKVIFNNIEYYWTFDLLKFVKQYNVKPSNEFISFVEQYIVWLSKNCVTSL